MNIKAERIEQLIQIINRNMLLAFSGQFSSATPMDFKRLQRVEAGVFGHDKFAFEMVHFVKMAREQQFEGAIAQAWEKFFHRGLETLLVECAIVRDDIERDCFVSRVYCWFTQKLSERRNLPRANAQTKLEDLKESVRSYGNSSHTLKGLDKYEADTHTTSGSRARTSEGYRIDKDVYEEEEEVPVIQVPDTPSRNVPHYVKQGFPEILPQRTDYKSFLPKIPGAEENYGMLYNVPETDAEKAMHELWMARRRQEAFEWKTQQHLTLVMDRLELHKSRMESDSLRRQESSIYLKAAKEREPRPKSADDVSHRFSPQTKKTMSGKRRHLMETRAEYARSLRSSRQSDDESSADTGAESPSPSSTARVKIQEIPDVIVLKKDQEEEEANEDSQLVLVKENGMETEATVTKPGRTTIAKAPGKREILPMRFRHDPPERFIKNFEKQQYYMQLSDSDDDDKPDRSARGERSGVTRKAVSKKSSGGKPAPIMFKREKPIVRERPESAKMFRAIAQDDPELKVMYRFTNFRRMPLSTQQEVWLSTRESERSKKAEDLAVQLAAAAAAKAEKKKAKDKGGDKKDKGKKNAAKKSAKEEVAVKPKPKYKSAADYMATHFPNFDNSGVRGGGGEESQGPMRTMQLIECEQVSEMLQQHNIRVKESTVAKGLMIPQDRPEAICLENMRENGERLMVNPLPEEYWRQAVFTGMKKGKKKKSKK